MTYVEADDTAQGQEEGEGENGCHDQGEVDAVETSNAQRLLGRHSVLAQQPAVQSSDDPNRRVEYGLHIISLREVVIDLREECLHVCIQFVNETIERCLSVSHEPACEPGCIGGIVYRIADIVNYLLHIVVKVISEERIKLGAITVPRICISA